MRHEAGWRRNRVVKLGAAIAAIVFLLSATRSVSGAARFNAGLPCPPRGAKILARGRQARVYSPHHPEKGYVWACLTSNGHRQRLGALPPRPVFNESRGVLLDRTRFRLRATWVAYSERFLGVDTSVTAVVAKDLDSSTTKYCRLGFTQAPSALPKVTGIVIKDNGSVAWLGETRPPATTGRGPLTREVGVCDSDGNRVVETGEGLQLDSLALHGSKLSWVNAGNR